MRLVRNHLAARTEPQAHFRQVPTQPTTLRCALFPCLPMAARQALAPKIHRTLE